MFPFETGHAPTWTRNRSITTTIVNATITSINKVQNQSKCSLRDMGRGVWQSHQQVDFSFKLFFKHRHIFWLRCFYYFCPWFARGSIAKYGSIFFHKVTDRVADSFAPAHAWVSWKRRQSGLSNYLMGYNVDFFHYFGFRSWAAINQG